MNVGDAVKLKGGGPSMTVLSMEGNQVECLWFTNDYQLQTAIFPIETIDPVKKEVPYSPKTGIGRL